MEGHPWVNGETYKNFILVVFVDNNIAINLYYIYSFSKEFPA